MSVFFITVGFFVPLKELFFFAINSDLYSHIVLIPIASIVFVFLEDPDTKSVRSFKLPKTTALLPLVFGLYLLYNFFSNNYSTKSTEIENYLAISISSFVLLIVAAAIATLPTNQISRNAFSLFFLVFMIPMPVIMREWVELQLQYASADAAELIFSLSSTPLFRDGFVFSLPGLALEVAPQCSGIHSSLVLFIVSIAATKLFLKSWWKRAILVGFIIPLAAIRNGFRVFVLGEIAVRYDPAVLHSWLHHRGGPIFFALSLIPLFALLYFLYRSENKTKLRS